MREPMSQVSAEPVGEALRRGLPPGSPRYLAVLFAQPHARSSLGALYAFEAELRRIVAVESHAAAHARLQWWRGELERLSAGRPTHPIAMALRPTGDHEGVDLSLLNELLTAADLDLARFTYHSWEELDAYCFRSSGALQVLICTVLAQGRQLSEQEHAFARQLGAGIRQADMLRDLALDAGRGLLYAPLDELEAAGVDPRAWRGTTSEPAGTSFLAAWRTRVRSLLRAVPSLLDTPGLRQTQRHGLVLAALHARMVERLDWSDDRAKRRLDLEPLARLWTAWRTAVRHA